jgi:hypothetical protein
MNRHLPALFVAALLGLLAAVGFAVAALGLPVLAGYLVLVVAGLSALARRSQALRTPPAESGRTCTCCTTTVFDPVEVR